MRKASRGRSHGEHTVEGLHGHRCDQLRDSGQTFNQKSVKISINRYIIKQMVGLIMSSTTVRVLEDEPQVTQIGDRES